MDSGLIPLFMVRGKVIPRYEIVSVLNKIFVMAKIYLKLFFNFLKMFTLIEYIF